MPVHGRSRPAKRRRGDGVLRGQAPMKGIAHFLSGIAAASFIPAVVQQSAEGAWLLVLAGVCALLPDTLDFKFGRFLEQPDDSIDPGPQPDAQAVACRIAAIIDRVFETGRPRTMQLHTVKLGPDAHQQYAVRFDTPRQEVAIRIGPVVTLSQTAIGPAPASPEARAKASAPMDYTYDAEVTVDIFSGPSFRLERKGEAVSVEFLPWHRAWSHGLVLTASVGVIAGLLCGWLAGAVAALGYAVHIVEDQLGAMGSNLLWPLARVRVPGLGLFHSGDATPNFITVWTACALTLFNLDRFSDTPRLPPIPYLLGAIALPALALATASVIRRRHDTPRPVETARQADLVAEMEEPQV